MSERPRGSIIPIRLCVGPLMRAGYLARAVVYGLIGFLAARAAWMGGPVEGAEEALVSLTDESFGRPLLWAIAGGAFGFALWSVLAAWLDLDRRGRGLWGVFARADFALTGAIYTVIGVLVAQLASSYGGAGGGEGEAREEGTAWLLSLPAGGWIVIALGFGFVGAGVWFGYKAFAGRYRERLRRTRMVERLDPVCKFGWSAYGVVIAILGGFLIWAGWTMDPSRAGGFAEAFLLVRNAAFGRVLLLVLAFGFIAFAVECLVEAVYRVVPVRGGAVNPAADTHPSDPVRAPAAARAPNG